MMHRMTYPQPVHNRHVNSPSRAAATLVEVLMSLLIMSIGIVSVFSLFPVAIISSIRASQLTNGVILQDNVRELLHTVPEILEPPYGASWKSTWQPFTTYDVGDIVIPMLEPGRLMPAPYFALQCATAGTSGASEPEWAAPVNQYADGSLVWNAIDIPNYLIDPTGYYRLLVGNPSKFGNRDSNSQTGTYGGLFPYRSYLRQASQTTALDLFSSPDSWSVVLQEVPNSVTTASTTSQVTFPSGTDVGSLNSARNLTRVILTKPDGKDALTRYLSTSVSGGNIITLNEPPPSPNEPPPSTFKFNGRARIEVFSRRYSYFLTVRNIGRAYPPIISSAIVFNRHASADSEHAYFANFGNQNFSGEPSVQNSNLQPDQVCIAWTSNEPTPHAKEGGYLFDVRNVIFYRITAVSGTSSPMTITLDRNVEQRSFNNSKDVANGAGFAILMPGILHVYNVK